MTATVPSDLRPRSAFSVWLRFLPCYLLLWFTQAKFASENTRRHSVVISPGVHSDVGGFYVDTDIYRAPLRDMMEHAAKAGVEFDALPPAVGKNYHFKSNQERRNDARWELMDGPRSFHPSTTIIRLGP